jgi:hypothetical protein
VFKLSRYDIGDDGNDSSEYSESQSIDIDTINIDDDAPDGSNDCNEDSES